jgi:hypothetical protein
VEVLSTSDGAVCYRRPPGRPRCRPGDRYAPFERKGSIRLSTENGHRYNDRQAERLQKIHERLTEARRELDALIGDAYLRPRASIVPVHFLDLASATEKLRWAEKEWRELERELAETRSPSDGMVAEPETAHNELLEPASRARS